MVRNISIIEKITVTRSESNFDRACDLAYKMALIRFAIDEDGYSSKLPDWQRSDSWIEIKFVSYKCCGNDHYYIFKAMARKEE